MKKNKILIVDDNKLNRQSLADIFRKAYQIVESEDGKKGTGVSEKDKGLSVAAIILDLIMPVMDGFAFLEEFKNTANISIFRSSLRQRKTMWKMKNAVWVWGMGFYTEVIPPGDHLVSCHERYQKEQTALFRV